MKLTLDPGVAPPDGWTLLVKESQWLPPTETVGRALVELMRTGRAAETVDVFCGCQMLLGLASCSGQPVTLDGVPRVRFYTIGGVVTVYEDQSLELEEIEFRSRRPLAADVCALAMGNINRRATAARFVIMNSRNEPIIVCDSPEEAAETAGRLALALAGQPVSVHEKFIAVVAVDNGKESR